MSTTEHPATHPERRPEPWFRSRANLALAGFLAISAFLLALEHRAHLLGALPWLLLLACPLMHLFMHGNHGGGHDHGDGPGGPKQ